MDTVRDASVLQTCVLTSAALVANTTGGLRASKSGPLWQDASARATESSADDIDYEGANLSRILKAS